MIKALKLLYNRKVVLSLLSASLLLSPVFAKNYYVSNTKGSSSNNGLSPQTPITSIQDAVDKTAPGDTVFIMGGTYNPSCSQCEAMTISNSGTNEKWIVIKNYLNEKPILKFSDWNGVLFQNNASYIEINGLTIQGNNANIKLNDALNQPGGCNNLSGTLSGVYNGCGISISGNAGRPYHHIKIKNCTIFDCPGAGISATKSDYLTIENNYIYNNCWYTAYGESGITLFESQNYDSKDGYHCVIMGNKLYGNRLYVPWFDAPCAITDGNGIIIDQSINGGYKAKILIAFNIVANNGGAGILSFHSENVDIVNNTAYLNQQSDEINEGEILATLSNNINIYNNILYSSASKNLNSNYSNTNIKYDYNLHFGSTKKVLTGSHIINADPIFLKPANDLQIADFSLSTKSPALLKGVILSSVLGQLPFEELSHNPDIGAVQSLVAGTVSTHTLKKTVNKRQSLQIIRNNLVIQKGLSMYSIKGSVIKNSNHAKIGFKR
jgi:parallel beta-helix repeat protein